MAVSKHSLLTVFFTVMVLTVRVGVFIVSPLYLDFFRHNETDNGNGTFTWNNRSNQTQDIRQSQPFFILFMQGAVSTFLWGVLLFVNFMFFPQFIGEKEREYPRKMFYIPGLSMALSYTMLNYCISGSRTAPYLQAILLNFVIPIQFIVRFLILRKRPTLRKGICVGVILLAEFVCLLPTIFPSLESSEQRREDGGSTGAAAILWPLCFVLSQVPYTTTNALMESSVKKEADDIEDQDNKHINMVFYLFWLELSLWLGTILLFFVDIIPGFGTSRNIQVFWDKFVFNLLCSFGQEGCGAEVAVLAWGSIILGNFLAMLAIAYLLRYSEGANYFVVIMTLRSPLLLLFWTLFDEHPFNWNPHVHVSTYLSIASLAVMIPAVIVYNTGAPERVVGRNQNIEEERRGLLEGSHPRDNIQ